jgi:hypothetical protein
MYILNGFMDRANRFESCSSLPALLTLEGEVEVVTKAFRITDGKGFCLTFANGYSLSVQFGPGNYCDHGNWSQLAPDNRKCGEEGSNTAEIAVFARDTWCTSYPGSGGEEVQGYCSVESVAKVISWIMDQPVLPAKVYTKRMWMDDVENGETDLGYVDWLASQE